MAGQARRWLWIGVAAVSIVVGAPAASAAPPSNDAVGGAEEIPSVAFPGFFEQQDTSEATTDSVDTALNSSCGADATEASVWFKVVAPGDSGLKVDVSNSFYRAQVIVAKGDPGNLTFVTCSEAGRVGGVLFPTQAGETYYLLAFDNEPGDGNGGLLDIFVAEAVPAPEVTVALDKTGTFDPNTGIATVTGTYTCTGEGLGGAAVFGRLEQHPNGFTVSARFQTFRLEQPLPCDGVVHTWTATAEPDDTLTSGEGRGGFRGGPVEATAFAEDCSRDACDDDTAAEVIVLHSVGEEPAPHAPPVNDTLDGIVHIPTFPTSEWTDTHYATTDAEDAALNASCGAPATEASVWFTLPGPTFDPFTIDTSRSDYSTTVLVATGTPGNLSLLACGHGQVTLAFPTQTLYVLVVDDVPGDGNGGTLLMSVAEPTAPQVSVTVSGTGRFVSKTGTALIGGTLTCSAGAEAFLFGDALQDRGRPATTIGGFGLGFEEPIVCDGTPTPWNVEVFPSPGDKYAGGPAAVSVIAFACVGFFLCSETRLETGVNLKR